MEANKEPETRETDRHGHLKTNDTFQFKCEKGIQCFNHCCADVNVVLTPYDALRIKNSLGITSGEFLEKYTNIMKPEQSLFPIVVLKMKDDLKRGMEKA